MSITELRLPTVEVRLTAEEKIAVPDWEEQVAAFQRLCDERMKDKRERFRVALHEGAHAVQYWEFGWQVNFLGPRIDCEDGSLRFILGAVSPIRMNNYEPLDWQHAMVSIAGFKWVEHFTGQPDDDATVKNDIASLRSDLGEDADVNWAIFNAEIMLEDQLGEAGFLSKLEHAVRDYELDVYGSDEATNWGWTEYRPEVCGTRYLVVVPTSGNFGTLIEHAGGLSLVVEGEVISPGDELRGMRPEVRIAEPKKSGAELAVIRWNETIVSAN